MTPVLPEEVKAAPARYLLKVDYFSDLKGLNNKYETGVFQSSGYKWKMIIYPDGDGSEDGHNHISVYLAIAETSSLLAGWDVNATFSFLLFDQIRDKFIVMGGMEGRFHIIKTERGLANLISLETFKEPSNGYLVNDKCVFGVDVYVIKNQLGGEYMSMFNDIEPYKHTWKISEFSKSTDKLSSEEFIVGKYKWKLVLHPTGNGNQNGKSVSLYLESIDAKGFACPKRVHAKFSISIKDQFSSVADHTRTVDSHWFTATQVDWGWSAFMELSELKDQMKGYLVNDRCIVEAEVSVLHFISGLT